MVPSEQQMRDAGERLGLLASGQPIPPRLRGKLAKVVEEALAEDAATIAAADRAASIVTPLADIYRGLTAADVPDEPAGRIVAALAPHIWRTINR
ncbi:hypothetical protein QSJ18_18200 [Gordonia sp. ABSL1-1]|uniref:hypothetical protein n=1 Tax=Gordonia sp. ABSL1-1 TaxID=3053923 RepID=UPI00257236B7|nr:hypothetical protein [Gordonia sp. ABSL1-1]MDL9938682.1 hypothetical protein [Gordonia sp. ABSL1-1]